MPAGSGGPSNRGAASSFKRAPIVPSKGESGSARPKGAASPRTAGGKEKTPKGDRPKPKASDDAPASAAAAAAQSDVAPAQKLEAGLAEKRKEKTIIPSSPPQPSNRQPSNRQPSSRPATTVVAVSPSPSAAAHPPGAPKAAGADWAKARGAVKMMGALKASKKEKLGSRLDYLTAEFIRGIAADQEKLATAAEESAKDAVSLASQLGGLLLAKMEEGMKTKELAKELFDKMDKNGDGSISKMEFRLAMRELGLVVPNAADKRGGRSFDIKAVDELFGMLDKDNGGDLDLEEITAGLKELQATAKGTAATMAEAQEEAAFWRQRAVASREAAAVVEEWDAARRELEAARVPSVESKLGAALIRKNLKPVDIVSQWDADGKHSIGADQFCQNFLRLGGTECTAEEVSELFHRQVGAGNLGSGLGPAPGSTPGPGSSAGAATGPAGGAAGGGAAGSAGSAGGPAGGGAAGSAGGSAGGSATMTSSAATVRKELDMERLKATIKMLIDAKEAAVQHEKRAAKLAAQKEAVAREVQGEMKRKVEEDEKRQEGKRSEAEAAAQREAEAKCEGERAEQAKRDAAKKAEQAKKESFEKKIEMKRAALTEAAWMGETKEAKPPQKPQRRHSIASSLQLPVALQPLDEAAAAPRGTVSQRPEVAHVS